jgi:hypothetical protein
MNIAGAEIIDSEHAHRPAARRSLIGLADRISRYTLGLVLIGAVGLKVSSLGGEVGLNNRKLAEALLIVGAELGVAVWLLSGIAEVWSRRAAMLLLMVFMVVAAQRLLAGNNDCGCFGAVRVPPALTLAFDSTSLAALFWLGRAKTGVRNDGRSGTGRSLRIALAVGVFLGAITLLAVRFTGKRARGEDVVILDPSSWRGKPFPMLEYTDARGSAYLSTGRHTVILYNWRCVACRDYLERTSRSVSGSATADISIMDLSAGERGESPDVSSQRFRDVPLRRGVLYSVAVPLAVSLSNGVVTEVRRPDE